jgi:PAS domain S-box-containing protein
MGPHERENYCVMLNKKQTRHLTLPRWKALIKHIDERKRAEQQLKASEESFRVLAETVPQLVWTTQPNDLHEYTNQHWRDYTGFMPEHIQRWDHLQFIHPDDRAGNKALWQHALDTGTMYEHEERLRNGQNGAYRWFLTRAMPVRDDTGQIVKWFGTCTDIEKQKRTEEALRQSQERVSALMNSSIIGINIIEGEQIVDTNETFLRMTGYTREDLLAGRLNVMDMTAPEDRTRTQQAHQELTTQRTLTPYEKEYICQDGSRLPVLVGGVALQHNLFQSIGFVLDNSARKELDRRKDDFLSMASHELKTPLTAVKIQTQLVRKRLIRQGLPDAAAALARLEEPFTLLERLVGELLDVSRVQAGKLEYHWEPVDLDDLLQEVADSMQQMDSTHTIAVRGTVSRLLLGDKGRLAQVFLNLISNAIKYAPDAPLIDIEASTSVEMAIIAVRDYGIGIPKEQREKIFERFYRVSDPSQRMVPGLGMGLSIVAEIVKQHGGTITVDSEMGKGSTFRITLPLVEEAC